VRLSGHFLPLATIAWGLSCTSCSAPSSSWASTTACRASALSLFGIDLSAPRVMYGLIWFCLVAA
jgi:branched-chain amino acid transport system permease protein